MKNIFITAALLLTGATYAQVTINQESNIADAMEYKKEVARSESAFQVLTFESPNYKVRIGSFRTRLEAEKNLIEIKKSYPAAFVVGLK